MRLPDLLDPPQLPLAELCAARLDGDLFVLGRAWVPADVAPGARVRAAAALSGSPRRCIAERETAAWVWGVVDRVPDPPRLCVPHAAPRSGLRSRHVREVVIDPQEIAELGGMRVTTPLRTAIDLARRSPDWADDTAAAVRRLAELAGVGGHDLRRALTETRHVAHTARARRRIDDAWSAA